MGSFKEGLLDKSSRWRLMAVKGWAARVLRRLPRKWSSCVLPLASWPKERGEEFEL